MNAHECMVKIRDYYKGKGMTKEVLEQDERALRHVPQEHLDAVFNRLTDKVSAAFVVSKVEIYDACEYLGVTTPRDYQIVAKQWICDCCGAGFTYAQAVTDDDRIDKGIHDTCPRCGFQPAWTLIERDYGRASEWYDRLIEARKEWMTRNPHHWDRAAAIRERQDQLRERIDASIFRKPRVSNGAI